MENPRITRLEWARLEGQRPRRAGCNSRIGVHGVTVRPPVLRMTTEDGATGFGPCRAGREPIEGILGKRLSDLWGDLGARPDGQPFDYPLWDLQARRAELPAYALAARVAGRPAPATAPRVRCYDTSLYIDDLHLASPEEAAALLAAEAREGYARGHRNAKIKVGRGARFLPLEEGTRRDIAVIRAVREAIGSEGAILIDANNGYNLNLAKRVLTETADCRVFWLEEPFHEDGELYRDLKSWLAEQGLATLIADGEGDASPRLLDWAREGLIDVVQYDYLSYGFTRWLATGKDLDARGARTAPHHYGGFFGNFVCGHLAGVIDNFLFIEWDEATVPAVDTSRYAVREGWVTLPDAPGFGLELDEAAFRRAVAAEGFQVSL
ncbi:MAG TPA: enolase C-terminal domain-like protein [Chloroflexota bacterium]|nr:enolase C-terminal domain-like protein [Chloroflexota bacterium]